MKIIRPTSITDSALNASTVDEVSTASEWDAASTYNDGARVNVTVNGVVSVYDLVQPGNTNHPPASSPAWWRLRAITHVAYNPGTTYAAGYRALSTATHRVYESLQAGNTGHALTDPAWWIDIGPTNRWAMFDDKVGTVTEQLGSFAVTLAAGAIDALALVDTDADTATVTMTVAGAQVYSRTGSTNVGGVAITDWSLYFFEPIGRKTVLIFDDLPIYESGVVTVTLNAPTPAQTVGCGTLIVGRQMDLGTTEAGAQAGIMDFSRKETDAYGVTSVVERPFAKRMTVRSLVATADVDGIQREIARLRARPVLWIGERGYDALTVYGFFKDFSLDLALSNVSYCSLTIEGLT